MAKLKSVKQHNKEAWETKINFACGEVPSFDPIYEGTGIISPWGGEIEENTNENKLAITDYSVGIRCSKTKNKGRMKYYQTPHCAIEWIKWDGQKKVEFK